MIEPVEEPPWRKFNYVPVAVLEEQKNKSNPVEADSSSAEPTSKNEILDEKLDINDVPMEESEVAVLEEQKNEAPEIDEIAEKVEDESNPVEADSSAAEPTSKNEIFDEKADINDVPMEESEPQDKNQVVRQDLNERLDLSLGLTSHDEDNDSDSKTNQITEGQ
ncbi:uncharacterized protein LOC131595239 isoform X2 [Vicia villosa]|uniref:uncharacterized protein LOC131595239 isoform X2 n=1 Tax=Vicia villosa TaxID=3911 RepID=UPI00273BA829|nr:uncharacterized protein LOC131595239 isoform X2 [Vicia villosa]